MINIIKQRLLIIRNKLQEQIEHEKNRRIFLRKIITTFIESDDFPQEYIDKFNNKFKYYYGKLDLVDIKKVALNLNKDLFTSEELRILNDKIHSHVKSLKNN